jgi:hypothetical protein
VKTFSKVFGIIVVTGAIIAGYIILTPSDPLLHSTLDKSVLDDHDGVSIGDLVNREYRFSDLN